MNKLERKTIDPVKTGLNLKNLRCNNQELRRYACFYKKTHLGVCDGINCEDCTYDMDVSISQAELASVFNVTDNVIANWECGKTIPSYEDLLFYSSLCKLDLNKIVIFYK